MSTNTEAAKPKGRKRLTEEERAAKAAAAEEKKRIAEEKKAAKLAAAESKRVLKAAIDDLKRQQAELRAMALAEENAQKCELIRQYAARMRILNEKKKNAISLRQSAIFDKPVHVRRGVEYQNVGGALRSPPGNDIIYEEAEGMQRANSEESGSETDSEREESGELEEVDWDEIELPVPN